MKALLILIILAGLIIVGVYFMVSGVDPAAEGQTFRQTIHTGMTWEEVADLKAPRKFSPVSTNPQNMTGKDPAQDFDRDRMRNLVSNGSLPAGFVFGYKFTNEHAWELYFDSTGKLIDIQDMKTINDLLTLPSPS